MAGPEDDATAAGPPSSVCPACGGSLRDWRWVPSSEPALGERRFPLRRCGSCGSAVTVGAAPAGLHEAGAYRPGEPRLYRVARPILGAFDAQRLSLLRGCVPAGGRVLDAGAGRGRFVAAARRAGFDAFGIEPSDRGIAAAAALGVPVQQATVASAAIAEHSVDAVSLWHVLEHLEDPGAALDRIRGWLRPQGVVLIGVPNLASVQARVGGERWYHLDVPRHRVHFTPGGLCALLHSRGFDVVGTHHLLLEHNPFGMWESLVNRVTRTPSYLYNLLKRNASLRSSDLVLTIAALPLVPVAVVAELIAGLGRRGGTIATLARRGDGEGYH